jgi:cell division protein FtsI/penicillin-binding protein 2
MNAILALALAALFLVPSAHAAAKPTNTPAAKRKPSAKAATKAGAKAGLKPAPRRRAARSAYNPWKEPTYADSTEGDHIDGDDLAVRRAAVEALGPLNGSVVAVDADTGRVLTVVNQKLAYKPGFTPCSTIKVFVGMGGLNEGLVERETMVRISRNVEYNLTQALAKSDNPYFAMLGQRLGFDRVSYYARLFGLGEKAAPDLDDERPGTLPKAPPANGGVGMMSSFGEGIRLTPLQLAGAMAAIANGGTLYALQYPQSQEEVDRFVPRVKRRLDIAALLPEIKPGLSGAVDYGTARRASWSQEENLLGKTGTCTDQWSPTHLGWFGSFNESAVNRLAVAVLLTGGKPINGPVAADVAGKVYRALSAAGYFKQDRTTSPVALINPRPCCL